MPTTEILDPLKPILPPPTETWTGIFALANADSLKGLLMLANRYAQDVEESGKAWARFRDAIQGRIGNLQDAYPSTK